MCLRRQQIVAGYRAKAPRRSRWLDMEKTLVWNSRMDRFERWGLKALKVEMALTAALGAIAAIKYL